MVLATFTFTWYTVDAARRSAIAAEQQARIAQAKAERESKEGADQLKRDRQLQADQFKNQMALLKASADRTARLARSQKSYEMRMEALQRFRATNADWNNIPLQLLDLRQSIEGCQKRGTTECFVEVNRQHRDFMKLLLSMNARREAESWAVAALFGEESPLLGEGKFTLKFFSSNDLSDTQIAARLTEMFTESDRVWDLIINFNVKFNEQMVRCQARMVVESTDQR